MTDLQAEVECLRQVTQIQSELLAHYMVKAMGGEATGLSISATLVKQATMRYVIADSLPKCRPSLT